MLFPLKDDVPTRSFPLVTVIIIVLNVLVYLYEFMLWPPGLPAQETRAARRAFEGFVFEFGLVPCRMGDVCPAPLATALAGAPEPWLTVFTSMFLHGGLFHLGGNMLYLWIFGNNVEDAMGKGRFVLFYLVCGVAAAAVQYLSDPSSPVPMIGASGAVSGALGAYLILHPQAHVWTLVWLGWWFTRIVPVPAMVVLGFWIVVQVVNALVTFGTGQAGGVAFLAHVGGFVAGMVLIPVFRRSRRPPARWGRPL
jgi:membrane associated rhomboid family serine protease